MPKVSVMIVTYNQESLIAETLESVLAQDYSALEVIVADDASTDGTVGVVADYAARYPNVLKLIANKKNLGITGNCNVALQACTGELVAILGGDDIFLPGKLTEQVKVFADDDVVLSYHSVEIFLHSTNETLFVTNTTERERLKDVYDIIAKGGIPGASSIMVRRSACPNHGFDPSFAMVSDWIFNAEVAIQGRIVELSGVYGRYRKHGTGASDRTFELMKESLSTLDVIQRRYPDDQRLAQACQAGGRRYILGEVFRQVQKRNCEHVKALRPMLLGYTSPRFRRWTSLAMTLLANRLVIEFAARCGLPLRNLLKRRY